MLKKVLTYTAGLYAVSLIASVMRIVVKSIVAKNIGKEALGAYSFYMTAITLGCSLLSFGLRKAITKYAAASKDENKFAPLVMGVIALGIAASIIIAVAGLFLNPIIDWVYVLVLLSVGSFTLYDVVRSTLRGQFDQKREIFFALLAIIVQTCLVVVIVFTSRNTRAPVWGLAAANIILAIVITIYFLWRYKDKWQPSQLLKVYQSLDFRSLIFLAAPLWITDILEIIGTQADQFIVQGRLGYAVLAEYAAAFTFIGVLDQPITVMSRVFLVTFAGGYYSDIDQYKRVSSLSIAFFSILGLFVFAISGPLTPILFTSAYSTVPLLVGILSISSIFNSVEVLNSCLTIACDYPQANRNSKIWTTAIYIPIAFLLVSRFGVVGAACSYVISWGSYAIAHALYMRDRLPEHAAYSIRTIILGTGLYIIVIATAWFIHNTWVNLLLMPAYLGLGHLVRLWDLSEIPGLIHRLLPKGMNLRTILQTKQSLNSKE
jgi:O-antigen/teichoic acid export membrane protein